jgi:hypothetical protein
MFKKCKKILIRKLNKRDSKRHQIHDRRRHGRGIYLFIKFFLKLTKKILKDMSLTCVIDPLSIPRVDVPDVLFDILFHISFSNKKIANRLESDSDKCN